MIEEISLEDSGAHYRPWNETEGVEGASKTQSAIGCWSVSSQIRPINDLHSHFMGILRKLVWFVGQALMRSNAVVKFQSNAREYGILFPWK
jgi:hypothetical protein